MVVHPGRGLSTARRLRVKKLWNLKAVGRLLAHGFFSSKRSWDRLALTAFFFNIENLVLRARSELNGFAGKDCELLWRFQVSGVRCQEKNTETET